MPAGYSQRPLVEKLGIKPGYRVAFLHAPATYRKELGPLPDGVRLQKDLRCLDFIHAFFKSRLGLKNEFPVLRQALTETGALWISWPKKSSGVETDLGENVVRETGLAQGLVDIKVCAVDDVWSGLKFVHRVKDRSRK